MLLWRLSSVTLVPLTAYLIWSDPRVDQWYDAPFLAGFIVFSAAAGAVVVHARHLDRGRRFFQGLAAAYAGAVLAALSLCHHYSGRICLWWSLIPRQRPGPRRPPVSRS